MVSTLLANRVVNWRRALFAGPMTTAPLVLYCEPWQGQT